MRKKLICIALVAVLLLAIVPPQKASASNADQLDISDEFLAVLKQFEGFMYNGYPYWDYGQYSIGYGSFCSYTQDDTYWYYMSNPLTEAQASEKLVNELQYFINKVRDYMRRYDLTLTQGQFDALVSLSYNIGATWTTNTGYYIHRALKENDINYIIYSWGLYSTAGGEYLEGLISRRLSEASMFADGIYQRYPSSNMKYVVLDAAGGKLDYRMHTYDGNRKSPVYWKMTAAPIGPDENGETVTYVLDGWYTAREGGTKVEELDGSLINGAILYAHWKTPSGTPVVIPEGDANGGIEIQVTGTGVNLRTGPGTYYGVVGTANAGERLTVTRIGTYQSKYWGKTQRGWIALDYTNYSTVLNTYFPHWGTVTGENVNVRSAAGTDAPVVTQKNTGDQVQILSWAYSGDRMWGKIEEGWIALEYVELAPQEYNGKVVGVEVEKLPIKTDYIQRHETLDVGGGTMKVTYEDGEVRTLPLSYAKVTGFDNTELGTTTVTISYAGHSATFDVNIVKATVTFLNYDGSVIGSAQYAYGEEVIPPEDPTRPEDRVGFYKFSGWDQEIGTCEGPATYTAQYDLWGKVEFKDYDGTVIDTKEYPAGAEIIAPEDPTRPSDGTGIYNFIGWDAEVGVCNGSWVYTAMYELIGDIDFDGKVTEDDAIYLLRYVIFPDRYPIDTFADFTGDGVLNEDDAIYLLRHVVFPERYPLSFEISTEE